MDDGLSSDNELFLEKAIATGVYPNREAALNQAVQVLRDKMRASTGKADKPKLSAEEWAKAFREYVANCPRSTHFVDDSRESIY